MAKVYITEYSRGGRVRSATICCDGSSRIEADPGFAELIYWE